MNLLRAACCFAISTPRCVRPISDGRGVAPLRRRALGLRRALSILVRQQLEAEMRTEEHGQEFRRVGSICDPLNLDFVVSFAAPAPRRDFTHYELRQPVVHGRATLPVLLRDVEAYVLDGVGLQYDADGVHVHGDCGSNRQARRSRNMLSAASTRGGAHVQAKFGSTSKSQCGRRWTSSTPSS